MSLGFIVRPLAEADLEDAARWYEDERAGLAERFFSDVDRTFARIRERPLQFPTVAGEVRRALLHTFPYAVYFRVSDQAAVVLAVLHLRRNAENMGGACGGLAGYSLCNGGAGSRRKGADMKPQLTIRETPPVVGAQRI